MLPKLNFRGFTLIELLVAISIIAIISAVGITSYTQAQKLARDAKRKQDLRSIAQALQIYKLKYGRYPCSHWQADNQAYTPWIQDTGTGVPNTPCQNATTNHLDSNYIATLPKDPLSTGGVPWAATNDGYHYHYRAYECYTNGDFFILMAQLENKNDPERIEVSGAKWCDGGLIYQRISPSGSAFTVTSLD